MALLDVARGDDRHTAERLTAEPVIWLGTVRPDGRPHNVPVWFAWHDPLVLIFSMPNTAKVRNMRASPAVSLSLDSADGGRDIVLAEGRATLGLLRGGRALALPLRLPSPRLPDARRRAEPVKRETLLLTGNVLPSRLRGRVGVGAATRKPAATTTSPKNPRWHLEPKTRDRARSLRHNSTDAERIIWSELRDHRLQGAGFRRQAPMRAITSSTSSATPRSS